MCFNSVKGSAFVCLLAKKGVALASISLLWYWEGDDHAAIKRRLPLHLEEATNLSRAHQMHSVHGNVQAQYTKAL